MRDHEERLFLFLTLAIGALVGLVVTAFVLITEQNTARLYPVGVQSWRRIVVPILGALVTGYLLERYFPAARGSGIPQTKVALFVRNGRIRLRTVVGKFMCSSASLASGMALGREGPSVQIGAGIASYIGQKFGFGPARLRALIPVGTAAALAAAFNTPIAAVLFTLEEVMGDLHAPVLGSIVLSSATSWVVLHLILGDEPLFHVPPYQLVSNVEFAFYACLGVAGGLVSVAFVKLTLFLRGRFLRMPKWSRYVQPTAGGIAVGIMGFFVPQVLGVGYNFLGLALNDSLPLKLMALLVVLKLLATASCYSSGNAGGIFGPSLFIGGMLGGAVGGTVHHFFPAITGNAGAYALVGMGTAFAGIVRTPLTSVFMIFEVTRDYTIVVPLMISNLISFYVSWQLQRTPIYEALAEQDGIHLPVAETRTKSRAYTVGQAMQSKCELIAPNTPVRDLLERESSEFLIGSGITLWGILRRADLQDTKPGAHASELLATSPDHTVHLDAANFPHVHVDHPLELALRRMGELGLDLMPVVDRGNVRSIKGVITLGDIMRTYGVGVTGRGTPARQS